MSTNLDLSGFEWMEEQLEKSNAPEAAIDLPGGEFTRGFAGEYEASMMYKLYTPIDVDLDAEGVEIPYDYKQVTRNGNGVFWYWLQAGEAKERAQEASKLANKAIVAKVWRWAMPVSTLLNYQGDDAAEKFGSEIASDIEVHGLLSTKRTDFHLLFLPSFVQSFALLTGKIAAPVFNYDQLAYSAENVTQEYVDQMIGPVKEGDRNGDTLYEQGELWQARAALWAALGEEEPKLWTAARLRRGEDGKPTRTPIDPKTDVKSPLLEKILQPVFAMKARIFANMARVAAVRMPNAKEIERDQKPFGVNVLTAVWRSKEEALAALGTVLEEFPALPAGWVGSPARDFNEWVRKYLADNYGGKPLPLVMQGLKKEAKTLNAQYAVTVEEIEPWVQFVLNGK